MPETRGKSSGHYAACGPGGQLTGLRAMAARAV